MQQVVAGLPQEKRFTEKIVQAPLTLAIGTAMCPVPPCPLVTTTVTLVLLYHGAPAV